MFAKLEPQAPTKSRWGCDFGYKMEYVLQDKKNLYVTPKTQRLVYTLPWVRIHSCVVAHVANGDRAKTKFACSTCERGLKGTTTFALVPIRQRSHSYMYQRVSYGCYSPYTSPFQMYFRQYV